MQHVEFMTFNILYVHTYTLITQLNLLCYVDEEDEEDYGEKFFDDKNENVQ